MGSLETGTNFPVALNRAERRRRVKIRCKQKMSNRRVNRRKK